MHGFHGGFGLGFLNLIGMVLFFGFIFMLIKGFAFRMNGRGYRGFGPMTHRHCEADSWRQNDAMQVARERFAKGEMSKEQFETIKAGLESEQAPQTPPHVTRGWMRGDSALELARLRFAKGEISFEEYEAIKKGLQN